jgi:hypothetical protein
MLLEPEEPDPRMRWGDAPPGTESLLDEHHRISIHGWPVSVTISLEPETAEAVWKAVDAGDAPALFHVDREFAPFWCPECAESYCGEHYRHWDVYDGPFFDCVRGRCPRGHERMLID